MFKIITLIKRREGMSREEFVNYYEEVHAKLAEKYLTGKAVKYFRRYLTSLPHSAGDEIGEPEFDASMEMWFADIEQWRSTLAIISAPDVAKLIIEDEEKFVDRTKLYLFSVEECESGLGTADDRPPALAVTTQRG